ncbi:MAG: glycoside hydrolase, partial [Thermoanaerobaculia bacterium]
TLSVRNAKAESQRGVIYSVAPGMRDAGIIWAGTDDGLLWVTRDGGGHWTNVTPPGLSPWSKVTQIAASAFDDETAYASVSRFRIDDLRPYIYRTRDGGRSWQPIVAGLPASPVNAVREDPVRKGLLYAGTETGVWTSFDDGDHWQTLQRNLPHTSVRDLIVHQGDLIVATHGRGFWILDDLSPLRQFTPAGATASAFLFRPSVALRVRPSLNTDTPLPADEPAGENPPDGAVIDYSLGWSASGPVTLEILDGFGRVARRYASTDVPWITDAELQTQTIPTYWVKMPETLQGSAGMHRWVWDLHYEAPLSVEHQYQISAVPHRTPRTPQGPWAVPGTYSVRLTANGKTLTTPLTVKMDPRVTTPPAGIAQMFELQTRLAGMLSRSSTAVLKAGSLTRQLDRLGEVGGKVGSLKASMSSFREQLTLLLDDPKKVTSEAARETAEETARRVAAPAKSPEQSKPPEPKPPVTLSGVESALASLYEMIDRTDATPTAAQVEAVSSTAVQFDDAIKRWDTFESTAIPRLNLELQQYHLEPLRPIAETPPMEGGEHEE